MSKILDLLSWLVTAQPVVTLVVLLAVTVGLGAGFTRLAPQADNSVFLPEDSRVAAADGKIEAMFGGSADVVTVTLLFRGDTLTPDGLSQMDGALKQVASDSRVVPLLAQPQPVTAPTLMIGAALDTEDFASVSQQQIDEAVARVPVDRLNGTDADGSQVSTASVRLSFDADDADALTAAELAIRDIVRDSQGPLEGSSLSAAVIDEESSGASGSEMLVLMVIALGVIAAVLLLFTRSLFDLALSLVGLVLTIVWVSGAQGWLGPNGVGLIGAPNVLTTMVPIMLIGLAVDYAIQTVGLYREQRIEGKDVRTSARLGLRAVIIPLSLAAVTTIVSFLTNIFSPIPANVDFGVVSGVGVAAGLIVMLTLLASSRALLDRRLESRGKLPPARPISGAIPGFGSVAEALGGQLARRPAPFLLAIGVITSCWELRPRGLRLYSTPTTSCPPAAALLRTLKPWTRPSAVRPTRCRC